MPHIDETNAGRILLSLDTGWQQSSSRYSMASKKNYRRYFLTLKGNGNVGRMKQMTSASEAEEAAWWKSNEDEHSKSSKRRLPRVELAIWPGCQARIVLGLPPTNPPRPRRHRQGAVQAAERGLRYQTYLKMIVHEALRNAESARKSAKS